MRQRWRAEGVGVAVDCCSVNWLPESPPRPPASSPHLPQALCSPDFLPQGGKLAVHLHNTYTEAALAKAEHA